MSRSAKSNRADAQKHLRVAISRQGAVAVDGQAHYETLFLNALSEVAPRFSEELVCIAEANNTLAPLIRDGGLMYRGLPVTALHEPSLAQERPETFLDQSPQLAPIDPNGFFPDHNRARAYRRAGINLIIELTPHLRPFDTLLPFVVPIFDLNHRLQPEFPEVSAFGHAAWRDYLFNNICRYATLVVVDSEIGKEDVLRFYGQYINEDRIRVLPYYPPVGGWPTPDQNELARVATKYRLPKRYFFYPAQFWPHKNHKAILVALGLIASEAKEKIPVVFCGSYTGYVRAQNFIEMRALAGKLGLQDRVHYLGQVPDEDMPALYAQSAGLVMPTFFGPTIIPPMEAWHYGCPVITSNIRGIREQVGDAGSLVDPRSPQDLAQAMLSLWKNRELAANLVMRGREKMAAHSWPHFVDGVASILSDAIDRVRSGRAPRYPKVDL
jgi:glycosyltransferase involved in cell wall biosynthesis